jgi:DNA-binding NarL/FixJ family response regulator
MGAWMKPLSVVIYQCSYRNAELLAQSLVNHFRLVNVAGDLDELRRAIRRHSADVAIVDLESTALEEIESLHRDFTRISIVCTHRLADERMWPHVLAAGAVDFCASSDIRAIVLAADNTPVVSHMPAA